MQILVYCVFWSVKSKLCFYWKWCIKCGIQLRCAHKFCLSSPTELPAEEGESTLNTFFSIIHVEITPPADQSASFYSAPHRHTCSPHFLWWQVTAILCLTPVTSGLFLFFSGVSFPLAQRYIETETTDEMFTPHTHVIFCGMWWRWCDMITSLLSLLPHLQSCKNASVSQYQSLCQQLIWAQWAYKISFKWCCGSKYSLLVSSQSVFNSYDHTLLIIVCDFVVVFHQGRVSGSWL